jgi:hypothetical protein
VKGVQTLVWASYTARGHKLNFSIDVQRNLQGFQNLEGFLRNLEGFLRNLEGFLRNLEGFLRNLQGFLRNLQGFSG